MLRSSFLKNWCRASVKKAVCAVTLPLYPTLLLCLALLVTFVSSCLPLNTYSGPPFTPAAVTYNAIEDTPAGRVELSRRMMIASTECLNASMEAATAQFMGSAEGLAAAGAKMLSGCRAKQECLRDYFLSMASGKIDPEKDPDRRDDILQLEQELLNEDLIMAESWGADRRAVGRIYYDYARTSLAALSKFRARGAKDTDPGIPEIYNSVVQNMQAAQYRGIAEAAAYLRSH